MIFLERIATLKHKEVINVRDGLRLGYVCDVVIDTKCGRILSLVVPVPGCFFGIFGRDKEYVIPWCCILRISEDIILVDTSVDDIIKICEV